MTLGPLFLKKQSNKVLEQHLCSRTQLSFALSKSFPTLERREGAAGLTAPRAAPAPTPHRGHFTPQGTPFKTVNLFFFSTRGSYLNFFTHDSFPKGVPVWEGVGRDGAVWAAPTETGAASPGYALFTSPLPL